MNQPVTTAAPLTSSVKSADQGDLKSGQMQGKPRRWMWLLYLVVFAVTAGIVAFNVIRPIIVLPRIAPSPGYIFTNQDGLPVTSEDARGRITLYSLTYAGCDNLCAQSIEQIATFQDEGARSLAPDTPLAFMTISVDPLGDGQAQLQQLHTAAATVVSNLPFRWDIVSGDPTRTKQVIGRGFAVYYGDPVVQEVDGQDERQITFDPRYVLVDGLGIIRAEYRSATPDPAILQRDVEYLLSEAANSDGIARLGYEAAHLFSCYPR